MSIGSIGSSFGLYQSQGALLAQMNAAQSTTSVMDDSDDDLDESAGTETA